ncbi:hypothetical protein ACLOJK_005916 [Asimina triloba]
MAELARVRLVLVFQVQPFVVPGPIAGSPSIPTILAWYEIDGRSGATCPGGPRIVAGAEGLRMPDTSVLRCCRNGLKQRVCLRTPCSNPFSGCGATTSEDKTAQKARRPPAPASSHRMICSLAFVFGCFKTKFQLLKRNSSQIPFLFPFKRERYGSSASAAESHSKAICLLSIIPGFRNFHVGLWISNLGRCPVAFRYDGGCCECLQAWTTMAVDLCISGLQ